MKQFLCILNHEIKLHVKSHRLFRFLILFYFLYASSIALILPDAARPGALFLVYIPISLMMYCEQNCRAGLADGSFEFLLSIASTSQIVLAKILSLFFVAFAASIINLAFCSILFAGFSCEQFLLVAAIMFFLIFISASAGILASACSMYFSAGSEALSIAIFPLIIPPLVIAGIVLGQNSYRNFPLLISACMVMIPACYMGISYLFKRVFYVK